MKEIIKKNKKTLVIILLLLLVLVLASTYAWLRLTKNSNTVNKITAGNLDIVLDEGNSITLKNEVPRSYRQGMETKEYTFTLTNNSSLSNYKLSLKDLAKYTDEDGKEIVVADENRIDDSKIRYILLKDGEESSADKSKILTDRTIDTGTIKKGQTISYSLRVWIDSRAGDDNTESEVMGKIFNVELSLVAEQTSQVTPIAKTICKRATILHTEECKQTVYYAYCSADGYTASGTMGTTMITYGNLGEKGQLQTGDAFDCDVNGDGIYDSATERFYYISEITNGVTLDSDTAVLVYYSNVNEGLPSNSKAAYDSSGKNYNGPVTAIKQLPTTSQWKNVSLIKAKRAITTEKGAAATDYGGTGTLPIAFDYSSYAARLLTAQEINSGCKITVGRYNNGDLSNKCKFLMENTNYSTTLLSVYGFWLESPNESNSFYGWGIVGDSRTVTNSTVSDKSNYFGVRPAIEVAKENIEY